MRFCINSLSLVTTTLLLSLTSPVYGQAAESPTARIKDAFQLQTAQNRKTQADQLFQQGNEQYDRSQLQKALEIYQQVLAIRREIGDRAGVGKTLNNIGRIYNDLAEYAQALEFYQQALAIRQELGDRAGVASTLNNIGAVYQNLSQYPQALEFYQRSLAIRQEVGDKTDIGLALNNIGMIYQSLDQYQQALEFYQQALAIRQNLGDRKGQGQILYNIGVVYDSMGQYSQALLFFQEALSLAQNTTGNEADILNGIGTVYSQLGQYSQALKYHQQALAILTKLRDRTGQGFTFHNIGFTYEQLKQDDKALAFYQQALAIRQSIGDRAGEGKTLNNIGLLYSRQVKYFQALKLLQQALTISEELGNRANVGRTLDSMGTVYKSLGQYSQSSESYQQALAIAREIGDRSSERITLSNIGNLLAQQNQPELAILFYKQSVNVTEAIRQQLRVLPIEQQQSYTATIADTYRHLADLLLQQNRVLEAQQVLDLLKVQELEDYLRNVRGNAQTAQGVDLLPAEQQLKESSLAILNREIQLGRELAALQKIPSANRTPSQQQRFAELVKIQQEMLRQFHEFINSPQVVALVQQLSPAARNQTIMPQFTKLQDLLQQLNQNAVLLYPLVLEDRLELVLTMPNTPPIHRSVAVQRQDLNRAIVEFRTALENPDSDATVPAQKLYNWLIKPIEKDLAQADAKTIVYAPDGQLRYIPLAALYDGKQWLAQRYSINNITALSLTQLNSKPSTKPRVLAAAFATGRYMVKVGPTPIPFSGLPFTRVEVENLAAMMPGTTKLLDSEFSPTATIPRLKDYTIVHLATHAMFVTGQPEDSFILFGDGSQITLRDIQTWKLPNADLVVLSACQTAVSSNGEEILGFGYQMQQTGAKAAIASLWSVNDGGTQALMSAFYTALQSGKMTKAEALQRAQVALITGDSSAQHSGSSLPPAVANRLSHPHYWAPFIVIGNGL